VEGRDLFELLVALVVSMAPFAVASAKGEKTHDTGVTDSCTISVEHVADLGSLDDPASVVIPLNVDLARVPWGGWLVTEDGKEILEYAEDGSFRRFFGRRGEGPGELSGPNAVEVDPFDSVWVSNRRGRSVIFSPEGIPTRTIVEPGLYQVARFTPSGLPMSFLVKADMSNPGTPQSWPYFQVWSRAGEPLYQIGPGATVPESSPVRVVSAGTSTYYAVTSDTVVLFPAGGHNAYSAWTPNKTDTVALHRASWGPLGLEPSQEPAPGDGVRGIIPDGSGEFWVLGSIRRLSEEDEDKLSDDAPQPGIERADMFRRLSAGVRNAVYDGWLGHMTATGEVTEAVGFPEYPWGFSGPGEFFTFDEDETGLVRIRIWRFVRSCPLVPRPGLAEGGFS
jgi:hypothetical protein